MNLRLRLTVVVGVTFALAVIGCTYAAHVSTSRQLRTETDDFLRQRAERFTRTAPGGFPPGPQRPGLGLRIRGGLTLADPDALTQILTSDGTVASFIRGQPAPPVGTGADKTIAHDGGDPRFRNVTLDGEPFRVLTVALPGGGAAQIARSVDEADRLLDSARLRLIALAGTIVAAALAWLIARRMVRPIEELTERTALVATTKEFDHPIAVSRRDEIGRLAASFNRMLDELRMSREQQRRLVMDASHELRTPLTALRTNVDVLRRAQSLDQAQRDELLGATDVELRELTDLVSELVDSATDTRSEEVVQPVDLGDLVDRVATRQHRRTGRTITVQKDEPAVVDGRVSLLERAVSNLVDNALKFSPPDSAVDVVARGTTVEVLDRGAGIPAEDLPHVFDRFYRATSARQVQGSGLGLAIVEQIADLHAATVTLAARPGGGILASLALPAGNGAAPHPPDATPSN